MVWRNGWCEEAVLEMRHGHERDFRERYNRETMVWSNGWCEEAVLEMRHGCDRDFSLAGTPRSPTKTSKLSAMHRGGMEKSFFWGVKLDSSKKKYKWDGNTTENPEECTVCTHTLSLRQAVLDPGASDDHVVEIETTGYDNKKIRVPVCVMKSGGPHVVNLEVVLEDQQATFHLVKGSGPVYLSGTHQTETAVIGEDEIEFDESHGDEEGEDEEDEDDEVDDMPVKKKAKK